MLAGVAGDEQTPPRKRLAGPKILFSMSVMHAPAEMMAVVQECLGTGWRVAVLIGWEGNSADLLARQLSEIGIAPIRVASGLGYQERARAESSAAAQEAEAMPPERRIRHPLRAVREVTERGRNFVAALRRMRKTRAFASVLFDSVQPVVVVSNNFHSCGRVDDAIAVETRRRNIPFASIMTSPLVAACISRPGRLEQHRQGMLPDSYRSDFSFVNRLALWLKPNWFSRDGDRAVIMWPIEEMLAASVCGLLAEDVWQVPSLHCDRVYAPGAFSASLLEKSGYPMQKVLALAPPRLDVVTELATQPSRRRAMYEHLMLSEGQPFVLWNVEPSFEHNYCDAETHWSRFHAIAEMLGGLNVRVVISLHPLCSIDDYRHVEQSGTIRISRDYGIHELYPFCAFAMSFGCSTNKYADIYHKKIVMYDWFGINDDPRRRSLYLQSNMRVCTSMAELQAGVADEVGGLIWSPKENHVISLTRTAPRIESDLRGLIAADRSRSLTANA